MLRVIDFFYGEKNTFEYIYLKESKDFDNNPNNIIYYFKVLLVLYCPAC